MEFRWLLSYFHNTQITHMYVNEMKNFLKWFTFRPLGKIGFHLMNFLTEWHISNIASMTEFW